MGKTKIRSSQTKDSAKALVSTDTVTEYGSNENTVSSGAYETVFDLTGAYEILSGAFIGISCGIRLTIDGTEVVTTTAQYRGELSDQSGTIGTLAVPPAKSESTLKLEIKNTSGGTRKFGWLVYVRSL